MSNEFIREQILQVLMEMGIASQKDLEKADAQRRQTEIDAAAAEAAVTMESGAVSNRPLPPGAEVPDKIDTHKSTAKESDKFVDTPAGEIEGNIPPGTPAAAKNDGDPVQKFPDPNASAVPERKAAEKERASRQRATREANKRAAERK